MFNTNSNFQKQSSKQSKTLTQSGKPFDFEKRTALFGEQVISLMNKTFRNEINRPFINQLVRSATSVGANYIEADGAISKRDFRNKLAISRKEAKETKHWLRMLSSINPSLKKEYHELSNETYEIICILSAIINKI